LKELNDLLWRLTGKRVSAIVSKRLVEVGQGNNGARGVKCQGRREIARGGRGHCVVGKVKKGKGKRVFMPNGPKVVVTRREGERKLRKVKSGKKGGGGFFRFWAEVFYFTGMTPSRWQSR